MRKQKIQKDITKAQLYPKVKVIINEDNHQFYNWNGGFAFAHLNSNNEMTLAYAHHCREQFLLHWNDTPQNRSICFIHHSAPDMIFHKAIATAMHYVEAKLGARERSKVSPCVPGKFTHILLSEWWIQNHMRKNFLTILLRAAIRNAKERQFCDRIFNIGDEHQYFQHTSVAVSLFMKRYTKLVDPNFSSNWLTSFSNNLNNKTAVKRILKR